MILIDYPPHQYKIRELEQKKEEIWDDTRRLWVSLTPEEWVRQNFVQYLIQICKYPASYIALEKKIQLGDVKKRFDILVYNGAAKPWMMVECKAREVQLHKKVLNQVLNYNMAIPVPYLVITNGHYCYGYHRNGLSMVELDLLPAYE
ncbi:MAG TPA: type I restriction enzyme HsdR N-terminal domain-containing protein [Chitinophagaceae bacterium]|nr:type I restriction enzyme HsdR N-terminal domain-containing protein [Chitinophagaceae bacterium]